MTKCEQIVHIASLGSKFKVICFYMSLIVFHGQIHIVIVIEVLSSTHYC